MNLNLEGLSMILIPDLLVVGHRYQTFGSRFRLPAIRSQSSLF